MMSLAKAGAATAALFLMVQPCLAADLTHNFGAPETRAAAFAGLQVRLPLGQQVRAKPTARLQLSSAYYTREQSGAFVQSQRTSGLELGAGKAGKPALYVGGQSTADIDWKLNVGGGNTLLIVGGVLVVVIVLAVVASAMPTAGPREGAFD